MCVFKVQQKVALIQQVFDRRMDIEIHYGNPELFKFKANLISKLKLNWSKQLIFSPKKRLDVLVASRLVIYFIYHGCVSCSPYQKSIDHRCVYCCLALAYSVVFDGWKRKKLGLEVTGCWFLFQILGLLSVIKILFHNYVLPYLSMCIRYE